MVRGGGRGNVLNKRSKARGVSLGIQRAKLNY